MRTFFTSESVTEGHPDKICDLIADGILDEILKQDKNARVACEVTVSTELVHIMGEITTTAKVDYEKVARDIIKEIGYTRPECGFDCDNCKIIIDIKEQSPDIAMGVNADDESESGAGDQGMMFGFACRETENFMPLPIELAHRLTKRLAYVRKMYILPYLLPDGKSQVTVEYEDDIPKRIDTIVVSAQHTDDVSEEQLIAEITDNVIIPVMPSDMIDADTKILINPTGRFVNGGPAADSGLTGRKIIVDTYGGYARHGGGSFSGKDPSKVDRSAAYLARFIAKNIVAANFADKCEVQLSYAIGVAEPVSLRIETFGTEKIPTGEIEDKVRKGVDMRPGEIIYDFGLKNPIYKSTASYGHFGENALDQPWEDLSLSKLWILDNKNGKE